MSAGLFPRCIGHTFISCFFDRSLLASLFHRCPDGRYILTVVYAMLADLFTAHFLSFILNLWLFPVGLMLLALDAESVLCQVRFPSLSSTRRIHSCISLKKWIFCYCFSSSKIVCTSLTVFSSHVFACVFRILVHSWPACWHSSARLCAHDGARGARAERNGRARAVPGMARGGEKVYLRAHTFL